MDQHQQTSWHPKSSLTSETSHWTSSSLDSVPLQSSSRLQTLISKWNAKFTFIWKEDFGPLSNSPVLFLLSPGKTPASVHSLWSSPKCFNLRCLTVFSSLRSSLLLVQLFLPNFFQSTLHLICFDTALCEQPPLSVMTFCVEGVNDCLLNHCQVSSFPHYCGFKEQDIPRIYTVGMINSWFYFNIIKIKCTSIKKPWINYAEKKKPLRCVPSKRWKLHLVEFEINIKLLLFHTNAGTDVHVRLESPRTRASSEAELCGKLQKCHAHCHAKRRHTHSKRTSVNTAMTSYLARTPKRTCGHVEYKSALMQRHCAHRMIVVWHQSTARATENRRLRMLSNRSRGTLMSYADRLRGAASSRTHLYISPSVGITNYNFSTPPLRKNKIMK